MTPMYVFDLDGTLSLSDHRVYMLEVKTDPLRWKKFYAACVDDPVNKPVMTMFQLLVEAEYDVVIVTGRSDEVRQETIDWLLEYLPEDFDFDTYLIMRKEGDHTEDTKLKRRWYDSLDVHDRSRIKCVFEDRGRVVDMWRSLGITCFQVAAGDF